MGPTVGGALYQVIPFQNTRCTGRICRQREKFWTLCRSDISGRRIHYAIRRDGVRALPCRDHDGFCATRTRGASGRRAAAMWVFISLVERYGIALQHADSHIGFARLLWLWIKCTEHTHTHTRFVFFLQFVFEPSFAMIHTRRILYSWFRASWLYINKIQRDATVCRCLFTAKLLYMFRVSIAPIIRSTQTNCSFWYRS